MSESSSRSFWQTFDGVLRDRESFFEEIFDGHAAGKLTRWATLAIVLLGGFYGACMGATSLEHGFAHGTAQMLSSAVKVPLLFLLSVGVCFPVLYFVIVLMGSKLNFTQTLALVLVAMAMSATVLAGAAPMTLFFTVTGSSYDFVKLLHVVFFTFAGAWGMAALWHGLTVMCEKSDLYPKRAVRILQIWTVIFGFVGAQMAWSLRPFVGNPEEPFELFRTQQESNIYQSVGQSVADLFVPPRVEDRKVDHAE